MSEVPLYHSPLGQCFKLLALLRLKTADPFAAWFVVTGDATPNGIRVVRPGLEILRGGNIISQNVLIDKFEKVNSLTKLSNQHF